ncbi:hypothetical protein WJX72_011899 [[Myrmecia] bisecta]|uniref:Apple domain-containing protein n=1 Tax=[Myrmecia] bisecta TaxID=41462 RepID=A0AAW1PB41_9CHLO
MKELKLVVENRTLLPVLYKLTHEQAVAALKCSPAAAGQETQAWTEFVSRVKHTTMVVNPDAKGHDLPLRQQIAYALVTMCVHKVCPAIKLTSYDRFDFIQRVQAACEHIKSGKLAELKWQQVTDADKLLSVLAVLRAKLNIAPTLPVSSAPMEIARTPFRDIAGSLPDIAGLHPVRSPVLESRSLNTALSGNPVSIGPAGPSPIWQSPRSAVSSKPAEALRIIPGFDVTSAHSSLAGAGFSPPPQQSTSTTSTTTQEQQLDPPTPAPTTSVPRSLAASSTGPAAPPARASPVAFTLPASPALPQELPGGHQAIVASQGAFMSELPGLFNRTCASGALVAVAWESAEGIRRWLDRKLDSLPESILNWAKRGWAWPVLHAGLFTAILWLPSAIAKAQGTPMMREGGQTAFEPKVAAAARDTPRYGLEVSFNYPPYVLVLLQCCVSVGLPAINCKMANSSNSNSNGSSAMSTDDILDEDVCSDNNNIGDVSTLFPGGMGNTTVEKTYTVNPEDDNDDNNGDECHLALKGFDVTGVTNEFALPSAGNLRSACDCVKECVKRIGTCHAWAWKYTGGEQRTCVLTSNTALPPQVSLAYDLGDGSGSSAGNETDMDGNEQYGRIRPNNLKQEGALVPRCTLNNGSYDNDCRSGTIFLLAGGIVIC